MFGARLLGRGRRGAGHYAREDCVHEVILIRFRIFKERFRSEYFSFFLPLGFIKNDLLEAYIACWFNSRIKLWDALVVINRDAFVTSDFPLILSLEDHCSVQQQTVMASMFKVIFTLFHRWVDN